MPFDRDYYQRFYFNPRTAVTSRAEMNARARLIAGCVAYVGLPVAKILDAGCGVGLLRAPLTRALRRADYVGLEYSPYLCERYGWRQGSIETFRCRERFDLVICYDVLQYRSNPGAAPRILVSARTRTRLPAYRLRHVAQARAAADTVEPGRRGLSTRACAS